MKKFIKKALYYFNYSSQYSIKKGYNHREFVPPFDDRGNKDEWQDSVYLYALVIYNKYNYKSLVDIGCGSAFKLIKYFKNEDFTGVELPSTLNYLKRTYPKNNWLRLDEVRHGSKFDLIILSDVIEHLKNPDEFLQSIFSKVNCKKIVISTPERDFIRGKEDIGPPINTYHYREWNYFEFEEFMEKYIKVEEHFISKEDNGTQIIVGTPM